MVKEDNRIKAPEDPDTKIWRYMDIEKFIYLAESKKLYFCNIHKLKATDPYEGTLLHSYVLTQAEPEVAKNFKIKMDSCGTQAVNCWHINNDQSMAMWKIYSKQGYAIAVQSTYSRLKKVLNESDLNIYLGKVEYIDHRKESQKEGEWREDVITMCFYKDISYKYENEIRALIWPTENHSDKRTIDGSICADIDCSKLIETVYVGPGCHKSFESYVRWICREYKLDTNVVRSILLDSPRY